MKITSKFTLLCSSFLIVLWAEKTHAANQYWDNAGTSTPTNGVWDTTTKNWTSSTTLTASTVVYTNGNFPEFSAGAPTTGLTITVNSAVTCAGIYARQSASPITFSGTGSIGVASGVQGFLCTGALIINVPLTGAGGVEQELSSSLSLYGANTYTGGTVVTGGQVLNYNNNNSFGTGPISISGSGNAIVNGSITNLVITNNFVFPTANYAVNLAGGNPVSGAPGTTFSGSFSLPTTGITTINTSSTATEVTAISGVISGGSGLTVADLGTLILTGTNTYTGATTISTGVTLALGQNGSISNTSSIYIGSGAVFNVSSANPYYLSAATMLSAGGTNGTTAAFLIGAPGGSINLGTQEIDLVFAPTAFNGDSTHPSLVVSNSTLTLNNNQLVVSNATATPLGLGNYSLIQVGDGVTGTILGAAPNSTVVVNGAGVVSGGVATASISGSTVILTVSAATNATTTVLSSVTPSSINYGSSATVSATATVSPTPTSGEVQFFVNGMPIGNAVAVNSSTGIATFSYNPPGTNAPATYTLTASYSGSSDNMYGASSATAVTYAISKAPLTVTANNFSTTYGTLGTYTFSAVLSNSETIGSVTYVVTGGTAPGTTNEPAGSYTITPSAATGGSGTEADYTITYATGTLTVNTKAVTITATAESMTYGSTYTGFGTLKTTNFSQSGFVDGNSATNATVTLTSSDGTPTTPAGTYTGAIVPSSLAVVAGQTSGTYTNFNPANYSITYAAGTFTVNKAAAKVGATPLTLTYGSVTNPLVGSLAFTNSVLSNSETIGSVTLTFGNTNVGTTTITPSAATGGSGTEANYTITYITNTLTITPLPVVLTGMRSYDGTAIATNTILTVSNAVGSDDVNVTNVPGYAVLSNSLPGLESITSFANLTLSGLTASNYTLVGASGSVLINAPPQPGSFLITSASLDATGTNFVVCWQSVPGLVYNVLTNSVLGTTNWASASGPIFATNTISCFTLPGGITASNLFVEIAQ